MPPGSSKTYFYKDYAIIHHYTGKNKYALKNSEDCLCSLIARTKLAATGPAGIVIIAKPKLA